MNLIEAGIDLAALVVYLKAKYAKDDVNLEIVVEYGTLKALCASFGKYLNHPDVSPAKSIHDVPITVQTGGALGVVIILKHSESADSHGPPLTEVLAFRYYEAMR